MPYFVLFLILCCHALVIMSAKDKTAALGQALAAILFWIGFTIVLKAALNYFFGF